MAEYKLNITNLKNAVSALEQALNVMSIKEQDEHTSVAEFETIRSGVIQNFEVAYEISWKTMKRWLEINSDPEIWVTNTKKEFYRIAAESNLISDVKQWWYFHESRNKTSHMYDSDIAEDVFETARKFLPAVQDLVSRLEKRV